MIITVTIPDELVAVLDAAATAAGEPNLSAAVAAHIGALIERQSRSKITAAAMQQVSEQVSRELAALAQSVDTISATCA